MENEEELNFRKEALDNWQYQYKDQGTIQLTPLRVWFIFVLLVCFFAGVIIWLFHGTLPSSVKVKGMIMRAESSMISIKTPSTKPMRMTELFVSDHQKVKKGDQLATLTDPDAEQLLNSQRKHIEQLQDELRKLELMAKADMHKRQVLTDKHTQLLEKDIEYEELTIKSNVRSKYNALKNILIAREKSIQNQLSLQNFEFNWSEQIRQLTLSINQAEHELTQTINRLQAQQIISAPHDGLVLRVLSRPGSTVDANTPIMQFQSHNDDGLTAIVYVDSLLAKKIRVGMLTYVEPTILSRPGAGKLISVVQKIDPIPTDPETMYATLQNRGLVEWFTQTGPQTAVHLYLSRHKDGEFIWTTEPPKDIKLEDGFMIKGNIIIRDIHPVELLFPFFKRLLEE